MPVHDVILWFGPAFAWVTVWTQFATLRFFDKNETLFKDLVNSGAIDLALSNIEAMKLIPALAAVCDAVAAEKHIKQRTTPTDISTEDVLLEVDFLPHLAKAEAALKEKATIHGLLNLLQNTSSVLWKIALLHSFAVILLPTSLLVTTSLLKTVLISAFGIIALFTFCWLIYGSVRYQRTRDQLLSSLSLNRSPE
jgi:hypothetical protein